MSTPTTELPPNMLITVCDKCRQASCWHTVFMCEESDIAGVIDVPVSQLLKENREHPDYWLRDWRAQEYMAARAALAKAEGKQP